MPEGAAGAGSSTHGAPIASLQAASPRVVLASASSTRRALLRAAGVQFEAVATRVDEAAVKNAVRLRGGTPIQAAQDLAHLKAAAIELPDVLVIGSDQILVCDGIWYDKPDTIDIARQHLQALRGRTHTLVTAVTCMRAGRVEWRETTEPALTMRAFSESFLDAYLEAEGEAVLQTVGGYRVEGLGMHLFERMAGEHSAILGLPMLGLLGFLRASGVLRV